MFEELKALMAVEGWDAEARVTIPLRNQLSNSK